MHGAPGLGSPGPMAREEQAGLGVAVWPLKLAVDELCVPRISSVAVTSSVALLAVRP